MTGLAWAVRADVLLAIRSLSSDVIGAIVPCGKTILKPDGMRTPLTKTCFVVLVTKTVVVPLPTRTAKMVPRMSTVASGVTDLTPLRIPLVS